MQGNILHRNLKLLKNEVNKRFIYNNTECCIKINAAFSVTLDLLQLYVEERLNKVFLSKKSIISALLDGKEIEEEIIKASWPVLTKDFDLINIYIDIIRMK